MLIYDQWLHALTNEASDAFLSRADKRKNRFSTYDFLRWCVAKGLPWRTRDGFTLVRGSDTTDASKIGKLSKNGKPVKVSHDGLKMDTFLRSLNLTEHKIRGAVNLLIELGILERIIEKVDVNPTGSIWHINWRKQARNPPARYRFAKWFRDLLRRENYVVKAGSKVATSPSAETLSSASDLPRKAQVFLDREPFPGEEAPASMPYEPLVLDVDLQEAAEQERAAEVARLRVQAPAEPLEPMKPLPTGLAAAFGRWGQAIMDRVARTAPPPPPVVEEKPVDLASLPDDAWHSTADQQFLRDWNVIAVKPSTDPRLFDSELEIKQEVKDLLRQHLGSRGVQWEITWFQQRDIHPDERSISPRQLKAGGRERDIRIGFRDPNRAFEFKLFYCGVPAQP